MRTNSKRDAFIAECVSCGDFFDGDVPAFTLTQGISMHRRGTGHGGFIYYAIETLATGEAATE